MNKQAVLKAFAKAESMALTLLIDKAKSAMSRSPRLVEFCTINNSCWFVDKEGNHLYAGDSGFDKRLATLVDELNDRCPSLLWNVSHVTRGIDHTPMLTGYAAIYQIDRPKYFDADYEVFTSLGGARGQVGSWQCDPNLAKAEFSIVAFEYYGDLPEEWLLWDSMDHGKCRVIPLN